LKWAPQVEKAEDILAGRAPTSAAELGAMLKVGELKALVVSRTGRTGVAKNNKAGRQNSIRRNLRGNLGSLKF